MVIRLLTILLITISLLAMDFETMIDNASEDEANVITNPITGKEYNIYTTYDISVDLIDLHSSGKLNSSLQVALEKITQANPNHSEKFKSANFLQGLMKNSMKLDYNSRKEILDYAKKNIATEEKVRIDFYLKHLEIGNEISNLQRTSIQNLLDHYYSFSDDLDPNDTLELLLNRASEIPQESSSNLLSSLIRNYLSGNLDVSNLNLLLTNMNVDMSEIACEQVRQDLSWLHEDHQYPGTLETIKFVKEEEPDALAEVMVNYKTNIENSAYTLNRLAMIGIPKETKCAENETLFDILANDEYFDAKDLNKELKKLSPQEEIPQIISPCVPKGTYELFKMCDFASIIWHLEKIERLDVKPNQNFITGDNIGNCEAFFETKIISGQKITNLKVIHLSGSEASLEASPKSLINYISK